MNKFVKNSMKAGEEWDGSWDRSCCTKRAGADADETVTVWWERNSLRSMNAVVKVTEESNQNREGGGREN